MEKISSYSDFILSTFDGLINEYKMKIDYPSDESMKLMNDFFEIIAWVDRYERRVNFAFNDRSSNRIYSSLDAYIAKGKPHVEIVKIGDEVKDNIIWHERFIRYFMRKELQSGWETTPI